MVLRIIFAGSPDAALPSLDALVSSAHEIVTVVTREDAPFGRKSLLRPTPVAEAAERLGIPVLKANRLSKVTDDLLALKADLGVVVAYGGLIREPLLGAPALGWINLHFSLLPRWRGAAPVQHAVIAGDSKTGVSVFQLTEELDAGDIYAQEELALDGQEHAGELLQILSARGAGVLAEVVEQIAAGRQVAKAQNGEVTLAPKLAARDGVVDWALPGKNLAALIRGVTPEPGAVAMLGSRRVKILRARLAPDAQNLPPGFLHSERGKVFVGSADSPLELLMVQMEGKRAMSAGDWWRGLANESRFTV